MPKRNKLKAQETEGFDSKGEYARWLDLKQAEMNGLIKDLKNHVDSHSDLTFEIQPCGCETKVRYTLDFMYHDISNYSGQCPNPRLVYEDFKGKETPVWKLKCIFFHFKFSSLTFVVSYAKYGSKGGVKVIKSFDTFLYPYKKPRRKRKKR